MTGNEPGVPGNNDKDVNDSDADNDIVADTTGEPPRGNMIAAEDEAAQETRDDRATRADAGDEQARAEQSDAERAGTGAAGADAAGAAKPDRMRHATEWLDGKLVPRLGGPNLGPYDDESAESVASHDACPLCGHPMGEHQIDRSHANAVLICPAEQIPRVESHEPLNEVGMVKRSAQGES